MRPQWILWPGLVSGLLLLSLAWWHREASTGSSQVSASTMESLANQTPTPTELTPTELDFGTRHQLTYNQWVELLEREARAIARRHPKQLYILAGDSLSLWFPAGLLPERVTWLNQGISGDTADGLLTRLKGFDATEPRVIFVMIGINDLIQGVRDETVLANQQEIIWHLKAAHPQARIVIQSILPHGGDRARQQYLQSLTSDSPPQERRRPRWVDRLPKIPPQRIQRLNQRLAAIAQTENVEFLDLYDLFAASDQFIRPELTTDGLHLSAEGYAVWRSQLEQVMASSPQKLLSHE